MVREDFQGDHFKESKNKMKHLYYFFCLFYSFKRHFKFSVLRLFIKKIAFYTDLVKLLFLPHIPTSSKSCCLIQYVNFSYRWSPWARDIRLFTHNVLLCEFILSFFFIFYFFNKIKNIFLVTISFKKKTLNY